jgi:hypothetical protein
MGAGPGSRYVNDHQWMVLGIQGTYLHVKHPRLTFGWEFLLLGWACILSDSTKVGWTNIEREFTEHHQDL